MTPKAQRIAICLHVKEISPAWRFTMTEGTKMPGHAQQEEIFLLQMPDYPNDLNAMHEVEKGLFARNDWSACNFEIELGKLTYGSWEWHATAAQRAEAFLKTIGKWEDDK